MISAGSPGTGMLGAQVGRVVVRRPGGCARVAWTSRARTHSLHFGTSSGRVRW